VASIAHATSETEQKGNLVTTVSAKLSPTGCPAKAAPPWPSAWVGKSRPGTAPNPRP
jgi:hypothetical protein